LDETRKRGEGRRESLLTAEEAIMDDIRRVWRSGSRVYDANGDHIGTIDEVYLDHGTSQPEWVGVVAGLLGTRYLLVPVGNASEYRDGLQVPFSKSYVESSPQVEKGDFGGQMREDLYAYYGIDRSSSLTDSSFAGAGSGGYDTD
jgi:hypothetical protein